MRRLSVILASLLLAGCFGGAPPFIPVDTGSAVPGGTVTRGGRPLALLGEPIEVGGKLPPTSLYDTYLKPVDLSKQQGDILFISIVPSIDTGVCERQTHILGEDGARMPADVRRITVSRDLPYAQKRFADQSRLGRSIQFLSDFQEGAFGRDTGLLVDPIKLLARSVVIVDRNGVIRYIQVVPEMGHLPDMEKAFDVATRIAREG